MLAKQGNVPASKASRYRYKSMYKAYELYIQGVNFRVIVLPVARDGEVRGYYGEDGETDRAVSIHCSNSLILQGQGTSYQEDSFGVCSSRVSLEGEIVSSKTGISAALGVFPRNDAKRVSRSLVLSCGVGVSTKR